MAPLDTTSSPQVSSEVPTAGTLRPGQFVGGPADGETGPTKGDRLTVVRDGVVHRYSPLRFEVGEGTQQAWIYTGSVEAAALRL